MFRIKKITRQRMHVFLSKHATTAKIIDLGAGDNYYQSLFPNKLNLDIDPARKPDLVGDVYKLPLEDNSVEGLLSVDVLEHLAYPQRAVDEMYRVLKPGGKLILITRYIFPIHDAPEDYFRYTKYGLCHLFSQWRIESLEEETTSFESLAVLLQRLVLQAKYKANRLVKLFLLLLIGVMFILNHLMKKEFGNIKQTIKEKNILTSGYYLIAYKR